MFWHMTQYAAYLLAASGVGLTVGWMIWGSSARRVRASEEVRVRKLKDELIAVRKMNSDADTEIAELRSLLSKTTNNSALTPSWDKVISQGATSQKSPAPSPLQSEIAHSVIDLAAMTTNTPSDLDLTEKDMPANLSADKTLYRDEVDGLMSITGIDEKVAAALVGAGINSLATIANSDQGTLNAALHKAGLGFAPTLPSWSTQAQYLLRGDKIGWTQYVDKMSETHELGSY